ncbi:filamentous hemagglutinin N-terminal domain-containing protein [Laspinema olomoucense]|uniref:filamentous hemagglutinin N-terminal domain-containing protein n=1 Tax=Laspinema olomoucense TaxID=3231600 RepID=UPI0021BAAEB4|nr:filamentous hemagglutinin N-terminal domain-containing protein [Laspinema sp. D3a]MCT7991910.1 filamentous hemagglutinin N-terminal domain-containing protein [Laspinema sp. D3a]
MNKYSGLWSLITLFPALLIQNLTLAQIVPDTTLPVNSQVTIQDATDLIEGGTTSGTHLFHSFSEFSVPTGRTAQFNNAPNIETIFTRITGSSVSEIDGLIRANGIANLFLLNPNGIVFGPNAALDIGGSFLGTTAESVIFADGFEFSTSHPQGNPLLTVSVPMGLQMGANPGQIFVQGLGHNFRVDPESDEVLIGTRPIGLQVDVEKTLALLGNGIILEGGHLTAEDGNIHLASVGNSNQINLLFQGFNFEIMYNFIPDFSGIYIDKVSSISSPNIQIYSQSLTLKRGSLIVGTPIDNNTENRLDITATESIEIEGSLPNGLPSSLVTTVLPNGIGNGSNITINTSKLFVANGGQVGAGTFGTGDSGNLTINASLLVQVSGTSPFEVPSRLFTSALQSSRGNGGNLTIETQRLIIKNGGEIDAATIGEGDSGTLTVRASEQIEISGTSMNGQFSSALLTSVFPRSTGAGGNIILETPLLMVRDGGTITASSEGQGPAGRLDISTESLRLDGGVIRADTIAGGGDIVLRSGSIVLRQNSRITTNAQGENVLGGNINIDTQVLTALENSDISANSQDFRGGQVNINAQGIFGTAFRPFPSDQTSDITATSERGAELSGIVTLNTPDLDPTAALVLLETNFLDSSSQITTGCQGNENSFTVVGRGGIPASPTDPLSETRILTDLGSSQHERIIPSQSRIPAPANEYIEATQWQLNEQGQVVLVAASPNRPELDVSCAQLSGSSSSNEFR